MDKRRRPVFGEADLRESAGCRGEGATPLSEEAGAVLIAPRVTALVGDITRQRVDAIVNAADNALLGGGGVDGAIHRVGGPAILAACRAIRRTRYPDGLPTGEAVATVAGDLPAKAVIHTVGPIYGRAGGQEAELLARCYRHSLRLAADNGWRSIAFPAISTGVYGYPAAEAAVVASSAIADFLAEGGGIDEVRLVFFRDDAMRAFLQHHRF